MQLINRRNQLLALDQNADHIDRKQTFVWLSSIVIFILSCLAVGAEEILIDEYEDGLNQKWEEKSFRGRTKYEVTREDNVLCVKATSTASASALYYKIKYDAKDYPILKWHWKVGAVLSKGNALYRNGDDYAARVYVVFPSLAFWRTKALNYIWANRLPQGDAVPNPFSSNAVMIAVESGPERTGQWVEERRNILADYHNFFGTEPPEVGAIAIMTDTDNTGDEAIAWYGPIRILSD